MSSAKPKQGNGAGKKTKASAPSSGTSTPVTSGNAVSSATFEPVTYGSGRPEKALFDAEQNKIKADIDAVQAKLTVVKDKLSGGKSGPAQERRKELLAELSDIRNAQGNIKQERDKVRAQLATVQETIQKKIKDLNASKAKQSFKSVAEVDERIKQLDKQVESGNMKLADEKRALAEITSLRRSRRAVEGFQAEESSIQSERATAEELKKQLDDPERKATSDRYDAIQAELDELKKQGDEVHASRTLQAELDVLYNRKRESALHYREANDKFFAKVSEDRARRAERERAQRAADEEAKKLEIVTRLREEAEVPAFQAQIEDCQTLINSFSGKPSGQLSITDAEKEKANLVGVPDLDIRKVDSSASEGLVVRKKKGEDDESYFVGGGGKAKKGRKQGGKPAPGADASVPEPSSSDRLNVPLATLSALLSLSIPPPVSSADVPRVIQDLTTKRAWFVANQARVTAENKAKAEKEIQRLTGGKEAKVDIPVADDLTPPNGGAEQPAEPAPTPAAGSETSIPVSDEEVKEKLENVEEATEAEGTEQ
ncbi:hypothetical protein BDW22DRAFT_1405056 [Trametopsis cervina]|nr:hypothetical protein BDW22DRAFT_1405056 [Trametopsis cervina]